MENSPNNIKFEFLHRDEGNYKIFGEIIFKNDGSFTIEEITKELKSKLIDSAYFYPKSVQVPLFAEHNRVNNEFTDWYEFHQFSYTKEKPTEKRSLTDFVNSFTN